jgi:hypothetical protein
MAYDIPVRGAKYRRPSNLDKLRTQLDEQVPLAAKASALAISLQNQFVDSEMDQASEGKIPPYQDPVVLISRAGEGWPSLGVASSVQGNAPVRSSLFGDPTALLHEATVHASLADSVSGLSSITTMGAMASHCVFVLSATNYPSVPHNQLPENKVEDTVLGSSMFSLSHRTAPGSRGHFWFLQVGIWYLKYQDSKMTMLLGLSSLMIILAGAIDGFALHPLDVNSSLFATNNRLRMVFLGLRFLPSNTFWSRTSATGLLISKQ